MAAEFWPMAGVAWVFEMTEPVAELPRANVDKVVGMAVDCVWFAAIVWAELAEPATALMA